MKYKMTSKISKHFSKKLFSTFFMKYLNYLKYELFVVLRSMSLLKNKHDLIKIIYILQTWHFIVISSGLNQHIFVFNFPCLTY